jgi:glycerate kinase
VLGGERGAARVFGPQKGATPAQVEQLSAGPENWARVLTRDLGVTGTDLRTGPGTGASGAWARGRPPSAPGCSPASTCSSTTSTWTPDRPAPTWCSPPRVPWTTRHRAGKVPAEAARRAKLSGRPVLALAGTLGQGAQEVPGVDACHRILPAPMALAEALARAAELLTEATERALRMIVPGSRLPGRTTAPVREDQAAAADVSGTQRPSSVR